MQSNLFKFGRNEANLRLCKCFKIYYTSIYCQLNCVIFGKIYCWVATVWHVKPQVYHPLFEWCIVIELQVYCTEVETCLTLKGFKSQLNLHGLIKFGRNVD